MTPPREPEQPRPRPASTCASHKGRSRVRGRVYLGTPMFDDENLNDLIQIAEGDVVDCEFHKDRAGELRARARVRQLSELYTRRHGHPPPVILYFPVED